METLKTIKITIDPKNVQKEDFIKLLHPFFPNCKILKYELLCGGITNKLFKVVILQNNGNKLNLNVRVNGVNTQKIINRKEEIENMILVNSKGLGAELFGKFNNGLVYEHLEGRTITPTEMKSTFCELITEAIAKFHSIKIPTNNNSKNMENKEAVIIKRTKKYLDSIRNVKYSDPVKSKFYKDNFNLPLIEKEIKNLSKHLEKMDIVFCHNDLLPHNIIFNPKTQKISFIDHEYCGWNFRAFEFADHFIEYAGDEIDASKYPSKEHQLNILRSYFNNLKKINEIESFTEQDVINLYVDVSIMSIYVNLIYGVWGIFQATTSTIDFDYLDYAKKKIDWALNSKNERLKTLNLRK